MVGLGGWGVGYGVASGQVEVRVPALDDETLARLADLAGPLLCVKGTDPEDVVPDGPQTDGGDGWRLLDTTGGGLPGTGTQIATSEQQYVALWDALGIARESAMVDFQTEVAIWFGVGHGGCGIRLDDVVINTEQSKIHAATSIPGNPEACTDELVVTSYLVAIPRNRLPEPPFVIHVDPAGPPAGLPDEFTAVSEDLRPAGAETVSEDEPATPPDNGVVEAGVVIVEDVATILKFHLSCSVDIIGPINSTLWRAPEQKEGATPPPPWLEDANDGFAEAELLLTSNEPSLSITINETTIRYEPIDNPDQLTMACG